MLSDLIQSTPQGLLSALLQQRRVTSEYVVPSDGPAGAIFVPATSADFVALGLTAPSSLFLCQEASGNLADSIGAVTATAAGSPTYQNAVTDWTRKFVGFTSAVGQYFGIAGGTYGPDAASQAPLIYAKLNSAAVASRSLLSVSSTVTIRFTTGGLVQIVNGGSVGTGAYDYRDSNVHPFMLRYNRTGTTTTLFTDKETISATYAAAGDVATKGIGAISAGATSSDAAVGLLAWWSGAAAEAVSKTTLSTLGWTLAY